MRRTVALDEDVERLLREAMHRSQRSFKETLTPRFAKASVASQPAQNPMTASEAAEHVRSWLEQPAVEIIDPGHGHVQRVLKSLENLGTAGNLVTDAQIAAATMEHNAVLHTCDPDFIRFPGLVWFNPITGTGSSRQRPSK